MKSAQSNPYHYPLHLGSARAVFVVLEFVQGKGIGPALVGRTRQAAAMTSAQEIRDRLEGYARAKIASVMQPLTEQLLVDQPGDPIEYMVRYLVQNRSDLRKYVVSETLAVREEGGRRSIPVVDHPLMDRIEELEQALKLENKFRRKEKKSAEQQIAKLNDRIKDLEGRLVAAGLPLDPSIDKEMRMFLSWDAKTAAASPEDPRDSGEFKFRVFESLPPMTSKHKSLMKNLLKDEKFTQLQKVQTSFGTTISNFIQAGVTQPKLPYGIACCDAECPSVFNDLYLPIVRAVHGIDPLTEKFETEMSAVGMALGEEREKVLAEHVDSIRIKTSRNISGLPFPPSCNQAEREEVETLLVAAFKSLDGDVAGDYERLQDMDPDDEELLLAEDLYLCTPEAVSLAAASGAARDWPANRGIFMDPERSVVCWCNGPEDHVTLQVLQQDLTLRP